MVTTLPNKKNKVILSDYPFQRDIENRMLMAQFSVFEVQVLEELLSGSLQTTIHHLARTFEVLEEAILPVLQTLSHTQLFKIQNNTIIIDKEMRKYYESQIVKFDEEFETGMEFLKGLLRKVPIDVMPMWYSLPRSTNDIFQSLVEKHLLTPKIYQRYLSELNFEDPILTGIMNDVFNSPDLKMSSKQLKEKYSLTGEQFEECMLLLEYNFVCCLRYAQIDDEWKEIVTPFHEWREYLLFQRRNAPQSYSDNLIQDKTTASFGFLADMEVLIKWLQKQPLEVAINQNTSAVYALMAPSKLLSQLKNTPELYSINNKTEAQSFYLQQIIAKLLALRIVASENGKLSLRQPAAEWLELSREKQALECYRQTTFQFHQYPIQRSLCIDKNIREVEKSLHKMTKLGWVKFEDFFKGLLAPIGQAQDVTLKKVGKHWKYALPQYTDQEKQLVKAIIFERLWEMGMVDIGTHEGDECFCMTKFGRNVLCRE